MNTPFYSKTLCINKMDCKQTSLILLIEMIPLQVIIRIFFFSSGVKSPLEHVTVRNRSLTLKDKYSAWSSFLKDRRCVSWQTSAEIYTSRCVWWCVFCWCTAAATWLGLWIASGTCCCKLCVRISERLLTWPTGQSEQPADSNAGTFLGMLWVELNLQNYLDKLHLQLSKCHCVR